MGRCLKKRSVAALKMLAERRKKIPSSLDTQIMAALKLFLFLVFVAGSRAAILARHRSAERSVGSGGSGGSGGSAGSVGSVGSVGGVRSVEGKKNSDVERKSCARRAFLLTFDP